MEKKQEEIVSEAVAQFLNEGDVTAQSVNVYKNKGLLMVDIVVESPYTQDDVDVIELECSLADNEDLDEDNDYVVTVYEKEDYDSRMSDGVAEDPDAVGDEDEDDDLHVIDPEEDDYDEDDDDDVDVDDDVYDNVAIDNYVPSYDDLIEFERDDY